MLSYKHHRPRIAQKLPYYHLEAIKELGNTPAITNYLQNRGIWQAAQGKLSEAHYFVQGPAGKKQFCAAGWRNEAGQWEVRNKYFQGCIGKTAPTFTPGNARRLLVFSSYFDYLSFLHENETSDSVLVINSLLCPSLELAVHYPHIQLYLEREPTRAFLKALPYATDHSTAFVGFRNYNEKRKAEARAERQAEERPRKDFMAGIEVPFSR
jgi:hypothetical protein